VLQRVSLDFVPEGCTIAGEAGGKKARNTNVKQINKKRESQIRKVVEE
jgi:hypothetical protein